MNKSFPSTVAGASILITAVGLMGKSLGLVREIVFANYFGLNTQYDLYLVGALLPLTINTVIMYLAQNYFIPNYYKLKVERTEEVKIFTNSIFWFFTFAGIALSLILLYFSRIIVNFYLQPQLVNDLDAALNVFRIFLITIPLNASFAVLAASLQAEFEFKYPAYSQLLMNIAIIILVILFSGKVGVYTIPVGYVAGSLFQLFFLLIKAGDKVTFNFKELFKRKGNLFLINHSFIIIMLIESISQIFLLADRYFFDSVQKGGIASLNYATNIFLLPVTIISVALSTAIFPKFSKSFSNNRKDDLQSTLDNFYSINLFLFVPVSVVLFYYGDVIIQILFQRGQFNIVATMMTFEVLRYYALSLIFYSSYAVINKLMYSSSMVTSLLVITIAVCLIKVALNFILVGKFRQNGLAISTSICYLFFFLSASVLTAFKLRLHNSYFVKELFFNGANALFSFWISDILISYSLTTSLLLNSFIRLIVFSSLYIINSVISKHNSIKLFMDISRYVLRKNVEAA